MSEKVFDDLARRLAQPMPRRRALRILGAAIATAAIPLARPSSARAIDCAEFGEIQCGETGCCPSADTVDKGPVCCRGLTRGGSPTSACCKTSQTCCNPKNRGAMTCCNRGEVCGDERCEPPCPGGRPRCSGVCCPKGSSCVGGRCVKTCPSGRARCGSRCCPKGHACVRGRCVKCPPRRESCGKVCCPKGKFCCDAKGLCCVKGRACCNVAPDGAPERNICCGKGQDCGFETLPGDYGAVRQGARHICCAEKRYVEAFRSCCPPGEVALPKFMVFPGGQGGFCCPEAQACGQGPDRICCVAGLSCVDGVCV